MFHIYYLIKKYFNNLIFKFILFIIKYIFINIKNMGIGDWGLGDRKSVV